MSPFETLTARLRALGLKPRSYSGRGMYGRQCVAIVTDRHSTIEGLPGGASRDALGLGTVFYWPSVPWELSDESED